MEGIENTFVTGVMEQTQLIPIPAEMEFFGIRFKPGFLYYLLEVDMGKLSNDMIESQQLNEDICKMLKIDIFAKNEEIVKSIESQLEDIFKEYDSQDTFVQVVNDLVDDPNRTIDELGRVHHFSVKNLERKFIKQVGLTPKKIARIMRFQKAHKKISKKGLENLIGVALSSGYYDQAHFNRD